MKLLIGKPPPNATEPWVELKTEGLYPSEIRQLLRKTLYEERFKENPDYYWTLNRTVMDYVSDSDGIGYENTYIIRNEKLIPILEVFNPDWLYQFRVGDLFEHEEI